MVMWRRYRSTGSEGQREASGKWCRGGRTGKCLLRSFGKCRSETLAWQRRRGGREVFASLRLGGYRKLIGDIRGGQGVGGERRASENDSSRNSRDKGEEGIAEEGSGCSYMERGYHK